MRPAVALAMSAAASVLVVAAYRRARGEDQDAATDWTDEIDAALNMALNPTPAASMQPSAQLLDMLKRGERLSLVRYRLGDGGWTIGYGRFYPDGGPVPPERIGRAEAEAWFVEDVEQRGARWVRAYVTVPLRQHQFDALVHIAYNLSPRSFKNVAQAVNEGADPEAVALRYVRAGTNLEAGLRNRRAREIALYRSGVYA